MLRTKRRDNKDDDQLTAYRLKNRYSPLLYTTFNIYFVYLPNNAFDISLKALRSTKTTHFYSLKVNSNDYYFE
jgi:hypothetical protein